MIFDMTHGNCWQVKDHIELSYPENQHICHYENVHKAPEMNFKRIL